MLRKITILLFSKWNQHPCCHALIWNQPFNCFWPEINIFLRLRLVRKINILLYFEWNEHYCGHALTWQQIKVFCTCNVSETMQTSAKTHTEHCLSHPRNNACEIWSFFDKVHPWAKHPTPIFDRVPPTKETGPCYNKPCRSFVMNP